MCPRCGDGTETLNHIFRECPITVEIWPLADMQWILNSQIQENLEWIIWVFREGSKSQIRLVCCLMWGLWTDRNKKLHGIANSIIHFKNLMQSEIQHLPE